MNVHLEDAARERALASVDEQDFSDIGGGQPLIGRDCSTSSATSSTARSSSASRPPIWLTMPTIMPGARRGRPPQYAANGLTGQVPLHAGSRTWVRLFARAAIFDHRRLAEDGA
jgi:hypothetical protein